MRRIFSLLLLALAAAAPAFAQQQEAHMDRTLKDRIDKPDLTTSYDFRKSAYGTDLKSESKSAQVKGFTGEKTFSTKAFDAKTFALTQEAWMAHSKYATKEAPVTKYEVPALDKSLATKTMAVAPARETGKTVDPRTLTTVQMPKGSSSRYFNLDGPPTNTSGLAYDGELKPLTIDDIRKLLNKNK